MSELTPRQYADRIIACESIDDRRAILASAPEGWRDLIRATINSRHRLLLHWKEAIESGRCARERVPDKVLLGFNEFRIRVDWKKAL